MPLRLIEMVLTEQEGAEVRELLKAHQVLELRQVQLQNGEVLARILLDSEQSEGVLDLLGARFVEGGDHRVLVLPVEATLPRAGQKPAAAPDQPAAQNESPERISREELYEDIKDAARLSRVYLAMVVLSTVVAAVGLYYGSVAIIIGAMVIAPLLGPNVALSLSTTLGDLTLLRQAFVTALVGIGTALGLAVLLGLSLKLDPTSHEVAARTGVGMGDLAVALASGCAGALAFTTGVSATLIGVMVAVALLPPLVTCGLLLGNGRPALALGALTLFLMNLICVNLAGVTTFLVKGIRPTTWWEKDRAKRASRIALGLWVLLLAALLAMVLLLRKG